MQQNANMALGLFMYPTGHHISGWRMPDAVADAGINLSHYIEVAQLAEAAKFDMMFFADSNTIGADDPKSLFRISTRYMCQFEPFTLLGALSAMTQKIGLIVTATTTYSEPYTMARKMASLDHLSGGRAAWNVVTSGDAHEAQNFGRDEHWGREERYDRAREYVDVVKGLWDSWEGDAFLRDKDNGIFFDPDKLHILNHKGPHFSVRGPLNLPRPPQGWPVIVQAGASLPGRDLSARIGEVVFAAPQGGLEAAKKYYADVKGRMAAYGRQPDEMKIMLGIFPVVGDTAEEAERKYDRLMEMTHPDLVTQNLKQILGLDVSTYDLDGPPPQDIPETGGMKSKRDMLLGLLRQDGMTLRKLYQDLAAARGHWVVKGTPAQIADRMEEWFRAEATDGFLIMPAHFPVAFQDFTDKVVPELQRRGLFRTEYEGKTLRDHLGLKYPPHFTMEPAQKRIA
jgi:FMN-dependent oxidoreductase (nitrilotriacetate monooxygenase family)